MPASNCHSQNSELWVSSECSESALVASSCGKGQTNERCKTSEGHAGFEDNGKLSCGTGHNVELSMSRTGSGD